MEHFSNIMEQPHRQTFELTTLERIESLKAGILSGTLTILVFSLFLLMENVLINPLPKLDLQLLVQVAMAGISGFLFGVTYRYIIRGDRNFHLSSGAVLAFGLVRGLGEVEYGLNLQHNGLILTVIVVKSILLFTAAQVILDRALKQGWIKPFTSDE